MGVRIRIRIGETNNEIKNVQSLSVPFAHYKDFQVQTKPHSK